LSKAEENKREQANKRKNPDCAIHRLKKCGSIPPGSPAFFHRAKVRATLHHRIFHDSLISKESACPAFGVFKQSKEKSP